MPRQLEASIHKAVVDWCKLHNNPILHRIFHVPNGERRDKITAARLKRQGVVAGIPDLCLPLPGNKVFWLELKTKKGRLSKVQQRLHANWAEIDHYVMTAYGYIEACKLLEDVAISYGSQKLSATGD